MQFTVRAIKERVVTVSFRRPSCFTAEFANMSADGGYQVEPDPIVSYSFDFYHI